MSARISATTAGSFENPLGAADVTHPEPLTAALDACLGDRMRADDVFAAKVWTALANIEWIALANIEWIAPDGSVHWESFRNASVTVSDIRGLDEDNYWYLTGQEHGVVDDEIAAAMAAIGWTWRAAESFSDRMVNLFDPKFLMETFR